MGRKLAMSFARVIIALWICKTCFIGFFVNGAVLERRIALPETPDGKSGLSLQPRDVTFVTKVVAVTSFLDPSEIKPSSTTSDPSDGGNLVTKVIRVGPTTVNTANCKPLLCSANVASVSVFYWPQKSARTACLSTISHLPSAAPPRGLIPVSPSIYAVFYSLSLSNGCGTLSTGWDSVTMSFPPGALSTVAPVGTTAEVFNFEDLPCPPDGLYVPPGQLYQPQFAPPRAFFSSLQAAHPGVLDGCKDGVWAGGWTDPPIAFVTADLPDGPGPVGGGPRRRAVGEVAGNAHLVARVPTQTAGSA